MLGLRLRLRVRDRVRDRDSARVSSVRVKNERFRDYGSGYRV
jgi:hypothetical protein